MPTKRPVRQVLAVSGAIALALATPAALPTTAHAEPVAYFQHLSSATLTGPATGASTSPDTAVDSAFGDNGKTLVSIDGSGVIFTDTSDPAKPQRTARVAINHPKALAIAGDRVIVARYKGLVIFDLAKHIKIGSVALKGSPTDVAASPDGNRAAVTVDNGRLILFNDLSGKPARWKHEAYKIELDAESGLIHRDQPQPDRLAYSPNGKAIAVTLPHNNGITILKSDDGGRIRAISSGKANITGIDTRSNGTIKLADNLWGRNRQPTGVAWIDDNHLASSSPGTRSWSVYDTKVGKLTWDSGNGLEYRAVENGLYSDANSADGGILPDTVTVATIGSTPYAFIGAKQSNLTAVYSLADKEPTYRQLLPTPAGAPVATSAKIIAAAGTDIFDARPGSPAFPTLQASWSHNKPLGWDHTYGLAADQFHAERVFTLTGSNPTQILDINVSTQPAKIDSAVALTSNRKPVALEPAGIYQRGDGRFLVAATGKTAADNRLLLVDRNGNVVSTIKLPADVTKGVADTGGLGGISGHTLNGTEYVWVAFKRPLPRDPDGVFRLGRYNTDDRTWTWFGYRPTTNADSVELGNINVVDERRLALVEQHPGPRGTTSTQKITIVNAPSTGSADHNDLAATLTAQPSSELANTFTRAGHPLPTHITGLATAGNDHGFLLADSARDATAGSQAELVDLGVSAQAFPERTSKLGTTLASWLLPLSGVVLVSAGCVASVGILIRSHRKRPKTAIA